MTTPSHSPPPWTVDEAGNIIDANGERVIADDGALYPEDRDLIVTAVNNHARLSRDLAAARRETVDFRLKLEESIAREDKGLVREHQLLREKEEMRERTIEEIAQFVENEPIQSWVPGILAKRIRALATQPDSHKEPGRGK
jgi:hypothetical protein